MNRKRMTTICLLACAVASATAACAASGVVINEVAWAGTVAASSDEWIELHNPTDAPIDLTGWVLMLNDTEIPLGDATGATVEVRRSTIDPGGFFLLERTDDLAVSDVEADAIYKGALSNAGALLELRDADGSLVDRVDAAEDGWPAGSAADGDPAYASMERTTNDAGDRVWCTNDGQIVSGLDADGTPLVGTPRAPNGCEILARVAPRIALLAPADEGMVLDAVVIVDWTADDPDGTGEALRITVEVSPDGGQTWEIVATNLANAGGYAWDTSTLPDGDDYRVRITCEDADGYRARAESPLFTIRNVAS